MADMELDNWRREMRSRPQPALNAAAVQDSIGNKVANRKRNRGARHGYRTRAARDEERDDEEFEVFEVVLFDLNLSYFILFETLLPFLCISRILKTEELREVQLVAIVTILLQTKKIYVRTVLLPNAVPNIPIGSRIMV